MKWNAELAAWHIVRPIWHGQAIARRIFLPGSLVWCSCGAIACWHYIPADGIGDYCDECVPRGCDCRNVDGFSAAPSTYTSTETNGETFDLVEPEQHRDDRGRLLPCVEFAFYRFGFPR